MKKWIIFLGFSLLLGCKPENLLDCTRSTGPIREEVRPLTPFENLKIDSDIEVSWVESRDAFILIQCGKKLMPKVRTEVIDRTLFIENQNRCNWVRTFSAPMKAELHSPAPQKITINGFGRFECKDTLRKNPLTFQHYGPSEVSLLVHVNEFYLDFASESQFLGFGMAESGVYSIQEPGKLKAGGIKIRELELNMKGENDAWVHATGRLFGRHLSKRNVYLKGKPAIEVETKSTGKIMPD